MRYLSRISKYLPKLCNKSNVSEIFSSQISKEGSCSKNRIKAVFCIPVGVWILNAISYSCIIMICLSSHFMLKLSSCYRMSMSKILQLYVLNVIKYFCLTLQLQDRFLRNRLLWKRNLGETVSLLFLFN